ncbi:uncharacterized protein LOC123545481 [Mercenaria mercenaria]|uniref:uncharacterized protein LOC123545481 n=1 Tax=Mercenaria mercenaria TaxID=6596 RepID=UPI00234F4282|nr:uncharacterized protein LOC123545481 [Mercenaria mercenaria]
MDALKQTVHMYMRLLMIISLLCDVYGYEMCYSTTLYDYYCSDGFYCCVNNTKCCPNASGLSVGGSAAVVMGTLFIVVCIVVILVVCAAKIHNRPGQRIRPMQQSGQAIIATANHQSRQGQANFDQSINGHPSYEQEQNGNWHVIDNKAEASDLAYLPNQTNC